MMGRSVRWASSIPVPAAAEPPSNAPSAMGSRSRAPPARFSSRKIPPLTAQAVTRIADWRPASFITASRCCGVGSSPATYQRSVGARLSAPATATPTMPSAMSASTGPVFCRAKSALTPTDVWPRNGIRMAAASPTASTYDRLMSSP